MRRNSEIYVNRRKKEILLKSGTVNKLAIIYTHERWFYRNAGVKIALIVLVNALFKMSCRVLQELHRKCNVSNSVIFFHVAQVKRLCVSARWAAQIRSACSSFHMLMGPLLQYPAGMVAMKSKVFSSIAKTQKQKLVSSFGWSCCYGPPAANVYSLQTESKCLQKPAPMCMGQLLGANVVCWPAQTGDVFP